MVCTSCFCASYPLKLQLVLICLGLTEGDIRVALMEKEAQLAKDGIPPLHAVTPSGFIVLGLELEDQPQWEARRLWSSEI